MFPQAVMDKALALVILGPTASGKSALAVRLRRLYGFLRGDFLAACGGESGSD